MHLLGFWLPDFTRISWVSDAAEAAWAPRLARIDRAWKEVEWLSVQAGLRPCAVRHVQPEEFVEEGHRGARAGLGGLPVAIEAARDGYTTTAVRARLGDPYVFRVVVGSPKAVAAFGDAFAASDDREIGRLLGFPPCCHAFFKEVWVDQGLVDTTWPMAANAVMPADGDRSIQVDGPWEANILWRWMGVRAVPHLPCSFRCQASVALAKGLMQVGTGSGYAEEMGWISEILSWPAEWSALHGIAEIKTPILRVSARTDATAVKYTVQRVAPEAAYPDDGATGVRFPYRQAPVSFTASENFRRGLDHVIRIEVPPPRWYASDNGFDSASAMEGAHRPIVELAARTAGRRGGNVLDLGCGNGALLERILATSPGVVPFGLDVDPLRIAHAKELHPEHAENFMVGDMFSLDGPWLHGRRFALVMLMPGRLLEVDRGRAAALVRELTRCSDNILVYAYGDWLARYGGLQELARAANLDLSGFRPGARACLLSFTASLVEALAPYFAVHDSRTLSRHSLIGRPTAKPSVTPLGSLPRLVPGLRRVRTNREIRA